MQSGKAERVAITHGGDGSILASQEGIARVNALPITAHSAVGAGDSFVGALIVGMAKGWDDNEALRYAMCAAAATRMTPGPSLFRVEDVERLFKSANIRSA